MMTEWLILALIAIAVVVLFAIRPWWIKRQWRKQWESYEMPLHLDYYDDLRKRARQNE